MKRLHPPLFVGIFALLTFVCAGAAIGRLFMLSTSEGIYAALLLLAVICWFKGRRMSHRKDSL